MKNILVSLLLISTLCSFTNKKKKPEPAIKKGSITAFAGTGWPGYFRYSRGKLFGPVILGADYQASKRWSFGLQYYFFYTKSDILNYTTYTYSGTTLIPDHLFQYQRTLMYHIPMATADFCYLNRGRVCLNSGIGLGYIPHPTTKTRFLDGIDHSAQLGGDRPFALAFRLRLVNAKVRITKNLGVYGGISLGVDGFFLAGVHYTFTGRDKW